MTSEPDGIRHFLQVVLVIVFFLFIAGFCFIMFCRGVTMLPGRVKELKQPESPKDKAISLFTFLYYIFLMVVLAGMVFGAFMIMFN